MKRFILATSFLLVVAVIFGVTRASLQSSKALGSSGSVAGDETEQNFAAPSKQIGGGRIHKVFVNKDDAETYATLTNRGAVTKEVDYGSFKMLIVSEDAGASREELTASGADVRDEQNLIEINGYVLDTTSGKAELNRVPTDLRQTTLADAISSGFSGGVRGGLKSAAKSFYIVQFIGPVKDEWLDDLKNNGTIVSYLPQNAYVVQANARQLTNLTNFRSRDFVQYVGDYEPAFRLSPELQEFYNLRYDKDIDITVQVTNDSSSAKNIERLKSLASEVVSENDVLNYHNLALKVRGSVLGQIASMDNVFAVEERTERRKLDEAQGQIVAGNLSGSAPTGPGYLSWLGTKGFNSSQFGSFAVNVADDAYALTGTVQHPDLPASRVAFQNNPTVQSGVMGGHGFLNSNIVGGYNNSTGTTYEDASGYNYGLGIAPFARVGITAIFGNTASTGTAWESTAYGQSARISSNSWGYTGAAAKKYDTNAQMYDKIVRDAQTGTTGNQQLIVVFAAGNDGSAANTVSSPATAKNIITVGASENFRQTGSDGCAVANTGADSVNDIIDFSSRGPVNSSGSDGRIKPDIVAPGTHIEAGIPQANYDGSSVCDKYFPAGQTLYGWSSGTSHSCPAVAGGSALLYQDFINKGLGTPSPALAKAILMNSAAYMNGTGAGGNLPSNNQGMGRMDLGRAFDGTSRMLTDQTQILGATGNTYTVTGSVVDSSKPYRVTLAWTDAPGPTTGAPFVNNLDLTVTIGGITYKGNVFSGANSASGGTADTKNNVESVFLPAGTTGSFTVTVTAANIAGDGVPGNADTTDQDFALVVYNGSAGAPPTPTPTPTPTATPTPTPTPTPTATPTPTPTPGGGELLTNGGFETSVSPWVNSGTGAFYTNNGSYPHGGTGYDYFGVNDSVTGQTYQQVAIPTTASGALTFWLNITSSETGSTAYDNLYVEVRNTSGTLLSTLATYSNVNKGTAGVYSQKSFNLSAYKGQTVRIQFRSTTDSSVTTTFRVDDVSLK